MIRNVSLTHAIAPPLLIPFRKYITWECLRVHLFQVNGFELSVVRHKMQCVRVFVCLLHYMSNTPNVHTRWC